jgi:hypothetical protein
MFQLDEHRALQRKSRKLTGSARLASTHHHINKTKIPCAQDRQIAGQFASCRISTDNGGRQLYRWQEGSQPQ